MPHPFKVLQLLLVVEEREVRLRLLASRRVSDGSMGASSDGATEQRTRPRHLMAAMSSAAAGGIASQLEPTGHAAAGRTQASAACSSASKPPCSRHASHQSTARVNAAQARRTRYTCRAFCLRFGFASVAKRKKDTPSLPSGTIGGPPSCAAGSTRGRSAATMRKLAGDVPPGAAVVRDAPEPRRAARAAPLRRALALAIAGFRRQVRPEQLLQQRASAMFDASLIQV